MNDFAELLRQRLPRDVEFVIDPYDPHSAPGMARVTLFRVYARRHTAMWQVVCSSNLLRDRPEVAAQLVAGDYRQGMKRFIARSKVAVFHKHRHRRMAGK